MRDYVPKIIGPELFEHLIGPYSGYDPSMNPSVANVFATAAFRFSHATIPSVIRRLNENFEEHELFPSLELHKTLFTPWRLIKEGQDTQLTTRATKIFLKHLLVKEIWSGSVQKDDFKWGVGYLDELNRR